MAYLSKEAYERKQAYADKRMRENKKVETLTEEQHETLAWICSIRHEIHSGNMERHLFCSQSADYEKWEYIDTVVYDNPIHTAIYESKLPEWDWHFNCLDVVTDADEDIDISEVYDSAIYEIADIIDRWNTSIENYLRAIDKKYGTDYCPTGKSRIF